MRVRTDCLTLDQIVRIYSGELNKWPDGKPIRLILRPEGDVDTMMLKGISPDLRDAGGKAQSREGKGDRKWEKKQRSLWWTTTSGW